jgi:hypothetical protein
VLSDSTPVRDSPTLKPFLHGNKLSIYYKCDLHTVYVYHGLIKLLFG